MRELVKLMQYVRKGFVGITRGYTLNKMINNIRTYAIADEEENVVEYFRTKFAALEMLSENQRNYFVKLKVIKLK